MRVALGFALILVFTSGAHAQSTYVGASFIGDVVRTSGPTSLSGGGAGSGEAFGGALRVGVGLGDRWGVELEFAKTGEIDISPAFAALSQGSWSSVFPDTPLPNTLLFPAPQVEAERELTTIAAMVWWNHEVNDRVSLAYLGGVAFTRIDSSLRIEYSEIIFPPSIPGGIPIPIDRFPRPTPRLIESESASYGADVAVGFEGRIGMTDNLRLVPGIRMQTAAGGWAIRPGIGVHWAF